MILILSCHISVLAIAFVSAVPELKTMRQAVLSLSLHSLIVALH